MTSSGTRHQQQIWDVIVVGTGMGGATAGYALAKAGRTVLFLEAGQQPSLTGYVEAAPDYSQMSVEQRSDLLREGGRACHTLDDGEGDAGVSPFIGIGTGGSSALYGMALERLFPSDFATWPITYEQMAPWYEAAERLYRVRGTVDPLRKESAPQLLPPPPLSRCNSSMFAHLSHRGLHPYQLHLACERVQGCQLCQGYICPKSCKNSSLNICLDPALMLENVTLIHESPAVSLEVSGRRVARVVTPKATFSGRVIVMAAGALASPRLMPDEANRSRCVGRYLMRHAIDLFSLRKAPPLDSNADSKELGLSDFYIDGSDTLGTIQSFGVQQPAKYLLNQPGRRWISRLGDPLTRFLMDRSARAPVVAAILQDDPNEENWVSARKLRHQFGSDDLRRRNKFRQHALDAFAGLGPVQLHKGRKDRAGLAHACGTCRFGDDPRSSALDRWNRSHDMDNLYVVDASFFPTSGGVGPALTVAANALRVADEIERRL